jgi:hypothetical protein
MIASRDVPSCQDEPPPHTVPNRVGDADVDGSEPIRVSLARIGPVTYRGRNLRVPAEVLAAIREAQERWT